MQVSTPSRRRWRRLPVRLSVRALMALVLLAGGGLGWVVHRAHVQRDAVAAIERAGGGVMYDWQFKDGIPDADGKPRAPKWLVDRVGVDYFGSPAYVIFTTGECRDEHLAPIGRLSRLERLDLMSSAVTDAGLVHLEGLTRLRTLDLAMTGISDAGLAHLRGMTGLQDLYLQGTNVGDAGLAHLKGMSTLKTLFLKGTRVSDAGLAHLNGLTNLEVLILTETRVGDGGLAHLETPANLKMLTLGRIRATYTGQLARLKGPSGFETESLNGTKVTDAGVGALQQELPLVKIQR
jgi:internalin A